MSEIQRLREALEAMPRPVFGAAIPRWQVIAELWDAARAVVDEAEASEETGAPSQTVVRALWRELRSWAAISTVTGLDRASIEQALRAADIDPSKEPE